MRSKSLKAFIMASSFALLTATHAHAAVSDTSLVIDGRLDYLTQMYNDDNSVLGQRPTNTVFVVPSVRADFKGKLGEETKYRMRLNLPKNASTTGSDDNLTRYTDYLYVERNFAQNFSAIFGKQNNQSGGWVRILDPNDVYYYPQAVQDLVDQNLFYTTGVGVNYEVAGQFFNVNVTSPDTVTTVGTATNGTNNDGGSVDPSTLKANNARPAFAFRWFGKFLGETLQPTAGYMTFGRQNQVGQAGPRNEQDSLLSVGLKYTIPVLDIEADYLANKYTDHTVSGMDDSVVSYYILARYKLADLGLKPFVTYEYSDRKLGQTSAPTLTRENKYNTYQVGIEYYPNKDENFRYHLVYANQSVGNDLGNNAGSISQNQQQIIAGVRFKADMLK